jgi:hypothetical protein
MDIKKKAGRPKKLSESKVVGVSIPIEIYNSAEFRAKTRYSSVSRYFLYLLEKDLRA